MRNTIIILTIICASFITKAQDFTSVTTADTLRIMNSVTYIKNDSEMDVWIGYKFYSENGVYVPKVASWDGANLKIYSQGDGLEFGVVRSVLPSKSGYVWLATATGLRKLMKDGNFKDYPLPQDSDGFRIIDDGQSNNMVEDGSGAIYCTTNLYIDKDIYNNSPKLLRQQNEVWKLVGETWLKTELRAPDNTINYNLYNDPEGGVIISFYDISLDNPGSKLLSYAETSNKKEEYILEDFFKGKIPISPNSIIAENNSILVSYKPNSFSDIYEGFSILNRDTKSWNHYGTSTYLNGNPDLTFTAIPSAVYEDNGTYFALTNWARKISFASEKGFWLSMEYDYKSDFLIEKGGGLLYFDGEKEFLRYSPGTHEGIEPFRPNLNLAHSSDGRDMKNVEWRYGTGVAYNKNGDLFVGALDGGLWIIPKEVLPQSTTTSVVEESNDKGFLIIPNMAAAGETVKIALPYQFRGEISSISITDQTGRTISTYSSEQLTATMKLNINTEGFAHGIYYVNMTIDNVSRTEKFIIK